MTTNLFVIANVKHLRTGSFRILLPFFRTSWGAGAQIQQFSKKMIEPRILVRLLRMYFPRNWEFGWALSKLRHLGGGVEPPPNPHLGTPLKCCAPFDVFGTEMNLVVNFRCQQNQRYYLQQYGSLSVISNITTSVVNCVRNFQLVICISHFSGNSSRRQWRSKDVLRTGRVTPNGHL
jgi:hypothetical protein